MSGSGRQHFSNGKWRTCSAQSAETCTAKGANGEKAEHASTPEEMERAEARMATPTPDKLSKKSGFVSVSEAAAEEELDAETAAIFEKIQADLNTRRERSLTLRAKNPTFRPAGVVESTETTEDVKRLAATPEAKALAYDLARAEITEETAPLKDRGWVNGNWEDATIEPTAEMMNVINREMNNRGVHGKSVGAAARAVLMNFDEQRGVVMKQAFGFDPAEQ